MAIVIRDRNRHFAVILSGVGIVGATLFVPDRPAIHGFAPDSDESLQRLVPSPLSPLPLLYDKAAECDGSAGTATPARPATPPQTWVLTEDYPISALRSERQGRTGFRLAVDTAGQVGDCHVVRGSGTAALDDSACFALVRRARFEPARDDHGCPIPSNYSSTVVWQIPQR